MSPVHIWLMRISVTAVPFPYVYSAAQTIVMSQWQQIFKLLQARRLCKREMEKNKPIKSLSWLAKC